MSGKKRKVEDGEHKGGPQKQKAKMSIGAMPEVCGALLNLADLS